MSGRGFSETDSAGEEVGPDFARGEDGTVTGSGGGSSGGPDFARGEDASVTGGQSAFGPDFARGQDRESAPGYAERATTAGTDPAATDETGAAPRRLRRWMVSDEQSTTPVVDESGEVIGEVSTEQVDVRPVDEDAGPDRPADER